MATVTGGEKLEAYLREMASKLRQPAAVDVGWMDGATYPETGTPVALVAATNEYGRPGQPPRPAIRNMIAEKSKEWLQQAGDLLKANGYDLTRTMEQMGAGIKGQMQEAITAYSGPALKPSTIQRKGFDKQLVDQGIELAGIDYRVK